MKDNGHLTEDQIIKAVADKSQLSLYEKEHLLNCSGCSSALESFENDLKQLGKIAESSVPPPKRRFIASDKRAERNVFRVFGLHTSLAAAITLLFFVITLHSDSIRYLLNTETGLYTDELYTDDSFISEIYSSADNALSIEYSDVYGESDQDYDDDFIDFIIPSSGSGTISVESEGGILS